MKYILTSDTINLLAILLTLFKALRVKDIKVIDLKVFDFLKIKVHFSTKK